jgi:hypothetical protein
MVSPCSVNHLAGDGNIFMLTLKSQLQNTDEIDLRKVFPPAIQSITKLVEEKLLIAANKPLGHE